MKNKIELIDKSALVAEIERRLKALYKDRDFNYLQIKELEALLSSLDTLEVKEVDLKKEYKEFIDCDNGRSMFETAKHFFELGLKAKGE